MQILGVWAMELVVLENNMLCESSGSRTDTTSRGEVCLAGCFTLFEVAHLKDSPVNLTHESVSQLLSHLREVDVVVCDLTHVHMLAEVGVGGVGSAITDSLCVGEVTIGTLSCRGTSEDTYLKFSTCLMLGESNLGEFLGNSLCCT